MIEAVWLKNGTEEVKALVILTTGILQDLMQENPIVLYELTMICRDLKHVLFGDTSKELQKLSLLQSDGRVHDSVRNIVLSAVVDDGLDMHLVNPIDKEDSCEH